tara:strand:- start:9838 stop:9993 length:156 start_codon:yes stop_codon:yes gene_type:complete
MDNKYFRIHPSNLDVITWEENLSKYDTGSIIVDYLIRYASEFLTKEYKIYQ